MKIVSERPMLRISGLDLGMRKAVVDWFDDQPHVTVEIGYNFEKDEILVRPMLWERENVAKVSEQWIEMVEAFYTHAR